MELWITSIATAAIAINSVATLILTFRIRSKDKEYRQQTAMLFKAIATSNLLTDEGVPGSDKLKNRIRQFNEWNEGGLQLSDPS